MFYCPFCGETRCKQEVKSGFIIFEEWGDVHPLTCYKCDTVFSYTCPACEEDEGVGRNMRNPIDGQDEFGCCHCGSHWNKQEWMEAQSKIRL